MLANMKLKSMGSCISLIPTMCLSYFFIAEELVRDCLSDRCSACRQINTCLQTLSFYLIDTNNSTETKLDITKNMAHITVTILALSALFSSHTLVTLGVKLSD